MGESALQTLGPRPESAVADFRLGVVRLRSAFASLRSGSQRLVIEGARDARRHRLSQAGPQRSRPCTKVHVRQRRFLFGIAPLGSEYALFTQSHSAVTSPRRRSGTKVTGAVIHLR